jgi:uncharacterized protein YqeY
MSLKDELFKNLKNAMKEKDVIRKNTIQSVRTAILQVEKDNQVELIDDDIINVIAAQVKKRKSALPEFEKSGRTELIEELKREISILMEFLPKQLSLDELTAIIKEIIEETGASTMKDMKMVMSAVASKVSGRADNKLVSEIVRKELA